MIAITSVLAGWAAGLAAGMYMLYDRPNAITGKTHFGGPQYALSNFGLDTKVALTEPQRASESFANAS